MNTLFGSNSHTQTQKKKKVTTDGLEMLKPQALGQAVVEQVAQPIDWGEWLGFKPAAETKAGHGKGVDMKPGIAYDPKEAAKKEKPVPQAEAPMDYHREILHAGESKKESHESSQKIQMLIMELQRLAQSVQAMEKAVVMQAIDPSAGKKAGKYYESFFEWMLLVVQDARRKVEDSGVWLSMASSKKKPGIHKLMKSNMQVGLSGERSVVTQTG